MKKTKKLMAVFLALLMIISAVPTAGLDLVLKASALDNTGTISDTISYTFRSGVGRLTISGSGAMPDYTAPDGWLGKKSPFLKNTEIRIVVIEDGITSIGNYTFVGCSNLASISIADSVTNIGKYTFDGCTSLESVTLPEGITRVSDALFSGCTSLESVTMPTTVTSIGCLSFTNCTALTNVEIAPRVTYIDAGAFRGCTNLRDVTVPAGVTGIGTDAFKDCPNLKYVYSCQGDKVSPLMSQFGTYTYVTSNHRMINGICAACGFSEFEIDSNGMLTKYNGSSSEIVIPDGVTAIGDNVFNGNRTVKSVTLPDSVVSIGNSTFYNCYGLSSINFPDNLKSIGNSAFRGCGSLTNITLPEGLESIGSYAFYNCTKLTGIAIPESITKIEPYTFDYCDALTSVTIPESVTSIGAYAFAFCRHLQTITISDSVKTIEKNAFYNCSSLVSATIPNGITSISNSLFEGCSALESIKLPDSVTNIGNRAFYACSSLVSVNIPDNVTNIGEGAFLSCSSLEEIAIPNSVTTIKSDTFSNCTSLSRITLPGSIESINPYAFSNCSNLLYIRTCNEDKIGNMMSQFKSFYVYETIDHRFVNDVCEVCGAPVFEINNGVLVKYNGTDSDVVIPDGVTWIHQNVFLRNNNLKSVTIPDSVSRISDYSFFGCENLEKVRFTGTEEQWKHIELSMTSGLYDENVECLNISKTPFTDEADFETLETENGAKIISGFTPGDTKSALEKYIANGWDVEVKTADGTDRIGTGSVVTLTSLRGKIEYTVVIYGDADGDSWYDAPDSIVVNCLVKGLLSREQVGETVWYAADCNHDGVVDDNDVALLDRAGLLLANIDQTKAGSLKGDSVFEEYLSLISQKTASTEEPVAEKNIDEEFNNNIFHKIVEFIIYLFRVIISYIPKAI